MLWIRGVIRVKIKSLLRRCGYFETMIWSEYILPTKSDRISCNDWLLVTLSNYNEADITHVSICIEAVLQNLRDL